MFNRDMNTRRPPMGYINPLQPKIRFQGFNPKWQMDWDGFIHELSLSMNRDETEIKEEEKVVFKQIYEEETIE
jgi:hypothetical protein